MSIQPERIQVDRERALRREFEEDRGVRRAIEEVHELTSGFGLVRRRRLLTGALRLTPEMASGVAQSVARARELLEIDEPIEVYVRPDPTLNAFCFRDPMGLLIVGLSSRLVESFSTAELEFVLGHELGHAYFEHFDIPMPQTAVVEDMAGRLVSRSMALKLYLWCRLAELTSDRIGLLCSRDPEAAISSFFKLASGVASDRLEPNLEAFASQIDSLAAAPEARKDERQPEETLGCFSTHPYSPSRVRALLAFARSRPYLEMAEEAGREAALSASELKRIVERDIAVMEPSYLEEDDEDSELMRHLLYQAGLLVAAADGEFCDDEVRALQSLLGSDRVTEDREVIPEEELARIRQRLDAGLEDAVERVALSDRAKLVQHLTIISAGDGETDDRELAVMSDIARKLEVNPTVITETLAAAARPVGDLGDVTAH